MFITSALPLRTALAGSLLSLLCVSASAQTPPAAGADPKAQADAACTKSLSKFDQTIALIHQTQGAKAAATLREKMLPAKLETDLRAKEGPCGLAKHMRQKKLID
jgi:hypothetical protein